MFLLLSREVGPVNFVLLNLFLAATAGFFLDKKFVLLNSLLILFQSCFLFYFQFFVESHQYFDSLSIPFLLMTTSLIPICILAGWNNDVNFSSLFLVLEGLLLCFFLSDQLLTFYLFFEMSLIPVFFIIGRWGGENKVYAAFKMFLYTFAGSVPFFFAIICILSWYGQSNINALSYLLPDSRYEYALWIAFFIAFAVKIPIWPLHTWLPDAHVQAPTSGSVVLAGILIKMGAYGLLKLSLPLFPNASNFFAPYVIVLSVISVIYASFVAFAQDNMKKLIAYSSVAHMGFVTAGIFSMTPEGINGAIFQMISHGFISSGLFLCVAYIYSRTKTMSIKEYSGLASRFPLYSFVFVFLSFASAGVPATSGFVGEFMSILGTFHFSPMLACFLSSGIILGAAYMLRLCKDTIWGDESVMVASLESSDINLIEFITLLPILVLVLLLGIYPNMLITLVSPYLDLVFGI